MVKKIRQTLITNKILIQNTSYLSIMQVINLIIPLISYPYLIRVLGKETYGLVVFSQAIIGYLVILVNFGFDISATKQVSINRYNKIRLNEIVSCVMLIKSILFLLAFIGLIILLYFIPQAKGYEWLFILSMWVCLYDVVFPMWYFQGIERMKYITVITLVSRLIFLGFIFVFIGSPSDYLYIPIINGIGALISGIISLTIIFHKHKVVFSMQPFERLKFYFKDSVPIFISNVSIKLYVGTNKVIVGSFLGMTEVAYYDLAEKLVNVLRMPTRILGQALFPKISNEKNTLFVKKIFKISVTISFLIYFVFLSTSKYITLLIGGISMMDAVLIVNILALTIPLVAMSNIFGIQLLLPFGFNKIFSKIIVSSGIIYFIQAGIIWIFWGFTVFNVTLITIVTEIFVTITMYYFCKKYKLWT